MRWTLALVPLTLGACARPALDVPPAARPAADTLGVFAPYDAVLGDADRLSGPDPEVAARAYFADAEADRVLIETAERTAARVVVLATALGLYDDSVRDERIRLVFEPGPSGGWTPVAAGRQQRCRAGRGHQAWGVEQCL